MNIQSIKQYQFRNNSIKSFDMNIYARIAVDEEREKEKGRAKVQAFELFYG